MAKNPAFPFYATDFLVDTMRWKRDMKSLHVDLLCESWSNGQLMDENGHPAGMDEEDIAIWQKIKHKWVLLDGIWFNEKLEECRQRREHFVEQLRENGRKGGRAKKTNKENFEELDSKSFDENNQLLSNSFISENQKLSNSLANAKPLEKEKEKEYNSLEKGVQGEKPFFPTNDTPYLLPKMLETVKQANPNHLPDTTNDFRELREISEKLSNGKLDYQNSNAIAEVLAEFDKLYRFAMSDSHFRRYSLPTLNKHLSAIKQSFHAQKTENGTHQSRNNSNHQQSARDRQTAASAAVSDELTATMQLLNAGAKPSYHA